MVVIASVGMTVMVYGCEAVTIGVSASATRTVNVVDPAADGAPEMTPVEADSVRPAGSVPADTANVYGESPPVAITVAW